MTSADQWGNPNTTYPFEFPDDTSENTTRWQNAIDDGLARNLLVLNPTDQRGSYYDLDGACPRCTHKISVSVEFGVISGITQGAPTQTMNVDCNCRTQHDKDHVDNTGCGWGGPLDVQLNKPTSGQQNG